MSVLLPLASWAGGKYSTVNKSISIDSGTQAGDVDSVNGSIRLLDGTVIAGNVHVHKPKGWWSGRSKPVRVEIGENVGVYGDLIFEHPVELKLHGSAEVGEVIGDDVTVIKG